PDYEILADTAEIDADRAHLHGFDLLLLGAKLPLFPLSLPLSSRQSGLLAPQFAFGRPVGLASAQPIFLTLGPTANLRRAPMLLPLAPTADATLAPGVFPGGSPPGRAPGDRSVKGPRLNLEGRYAPIEGTAGFLGLDLFYDLDQHGPNGTGPGRGYGGVRGV